MYRHITIDTSISQDKTSPSKWDQAITEAKTKINQLQYTIKVFKELRDSGEPWPDRNVE